jgi:hypothetical protein
MIQEINRKILRSTEEKSRRDRITRGIFISEIGLKKKYVMSQDNLSKWKEWL